MIIREEPDHYLFITQHDHAYIPGEMFSKLRACLNFNGKKGYVLISE